MVVPEGEATGYEITRAEDGRTTPKRETHFYGDAIAIHEAPVWDGHEFLYWRDSEYRPGDDYIVTEDHMFVAQWKAKTIPDTNIARLGDNILGVFALIAGSIMAGAAVWIMKRNRNA